MISVIIPVKNGSDTLARCLQTLREQTVKDLEIIVLDSESTDNSVDIAKQYGASVFNIPAATFNHGLTRNLGLQYAHGDLIYFTVQDAWIAESNMLERMLAHFNSIEVQSVAGMQAVPHEPDKNPVRWFRRFTIPVAEKRYLSSGEWQKLTSMQQLQLCRWDNVNCMYRKEALLKQPFAPVNLAEDIIWAKQALQSGKTILRDASLYVYHYHHQTFSYTFRVKFAEYYVIHQEFNLLPALPSFIRPWVRACYSLIKNKSVPFFKKIYWGSHHFMLLLADVCCVATYRMLFLINGNKAIAAGLRYFCKTVPQGKQSNL